MKRLVRDEGGAVAAPLPPNIQKARDDSGLTTRELEVADLLLNERTYQHKAIAKALGISQRTVEIHLSNIGAKLGAKSKAHILLLWRDINRQPADHDCRCDCRRSSTP